ncbi:MAG TPA: QacE family quaternary ammonium compound efflux SMR transporter [Firmicutes bacterium]|nr:QacE family quaternary ammonium compound efflux SMR transporter [Bacillota bacterium]
MNGYLYLVTAIVLEVFSTSMMKYSAGFTKLYPSIAFAVGMSASFYAVAQAMITIPLNIAYTIWAGMGTVLTALVSVFVWKESINMYSGLGIALIVIGVVLLNLKGPAH